MGDIDRFLAILGKGPRDGGHVFNPWKDSDARDHAPRRDMPRRRLDNMAAYLDARRHSAEVLLLGEAPSHRGCRFTGIAFCSEVELTHKAKLVARAPLALTSADHETKPVREPSAAVIWGELDHGGCAHQVVLWNAFPWHPWKPDAKAGPSGPSSNRRPAPDEVKQGREALQALMACFTKPVRIYAVGRVAEEALGRWDEFHSHGCIRHPSMGGANLFRSQFRESVLAHLKP